MPMLSELVSNHNFVIYPFFDVLRMWLRRPLTRDELWRCGSHVQTHHNGQWTRTANRKIQVWFPDLHYRQRVTLWQPPRQVLEVFASRNDALLNYAEVAFDFLASGEPWQVHHALDQLLEAFRDGFLQARHGTKQCRAYPYGFTTRTYPAAGQRHNGRWYHCYIDRPSKVTGEPCFHFEGRHQGADACRRIGIRHPHDMLSFNFAAYARNHIVLWQIDYERLGRFHRNRRTGSRAKKSLIAYSGGVPFNRDIAFGARLYKIHSWHPPFRDERGNMIESETSSLQQFVDYYGRGPFLRRQDTHIIHDYLQLAQTSS